MGMELKNRLFSIRIGTISITNVDASIKKTLGFFEGTSFIQLVPLKLVTSKEQLLFALEQTLSAFESRENFSDKLSSEFLARSLGTRQIGKAISATEFKRGENNVALVVLCNSEKELKQALDFAEKELSFEEKHSLLEKSLHENFTELKEFFRVSDEEISALSLPKEDALKKAVLERVAFAGG